MNDPIVDEVRRVRDEHAARFDYDLDAIFRDIKEQEKKSGRKFVSFPPGGVESNQAPQPAGPAPAISDSIPTQEAGPPGSPAAVLAAVEASPPVPAGGVDELEQLIAHGRRSPSRPDPFIR
jgi:hypothetical protein